MKYRRLDEGRLELQLEGEKIEEVLVVIARHSYFTAAPRGLGTLQPFLTPVEEIDVRPFIQRRWGRIGSPTMLLMDYVNGNDCRTKVYQSQEDGKWYFDAYAFEQRLVTAEEFHAGIRRVRAEEFLDDVVNILEERKTK